MMTIIVGYEYEKLAATQHGNGKYGEGGFKIRVSKNPESAKKKMGKKNAVVYITSGVSQ